MSDPKATILVVEDDLDVADMLNAFFRAQGYDVLTVNWGEDALRICTTTLPDLIILDIRLPDIDGFEVARRLRSNRRTREAPIIFLTEKRARKDKLQGLELGADDYITKPFDVQELRLRVRNALRRSAPSSVINSITNLPDGAMVDERLEECLGKKTWGILKVSVDNLDSFREAYGFVASDDVLRATSLMLQNALKETNGPSDFLGQYGPFGFILICSPEILDNLCERVRTRLEQSLDYFYPLSYRMNETTGEKRLSIRIQQLTTGDGPFQTVDSIKKKLQ
ncbi:MAG: response regulator [Chloroflexi bacterium]|nr:MAG: response regulator [Chloroflexota bacterium]